MLENDSPNYAEYAYEQKSEGVVLVKRLLMIGLYFAYTIGFFAFAMISKLFQIFALWPLTLYILFLCTWRLVKFDCYVEFKMGTLYLGKIKVNKSDRRKTPKISIHVKEALDISEYTDKSQLGDVKKIYDYSESPRSNKRIYVVYLENGARCAAIFEGTARLASLLTSFCPNAHDIKGKAFHG